MQRIVDTAIDILAEGAVDSLTTREVARRLSISQPTLYSHVSGLDEIRSLAAIRGMAELSGRVRAAVQGRSGDAALWAMARAYRGFVRENPALYMLQQRAPWPPEYQDEALTAAEPVRGVLRTYGLTEDQVLHVHLVFRTSVHGFVDQETNDAIADVADPDTSFDYFLTMLAAGIRSLVDQGPDSART